jgi:hypothetical protein
VDSVYDFPIHIPSGRELSWFFCVSALASLIWLQGVKVFHETKPPTLYMVVSYRRTSGDDHTCGRCMVWTFLFVISLFGLTPRSMVYVQKEFTGFNIFMFLSKNDLFNWFVHQPFYFLDPGETRRIGAHERGKMAKFYHYLCKKKMKNTMQKTLIGATRVASTLHMSWWQYLASSGDC